MTLCVIPLKEMGEFVGEGVDDAGFGERSGWGVIGGYPDPDGLLNKVALAEGGFITSAAVEHHGSYPDIFERDVKGLCAVMG